MNPLRIGLLGVRAGQPYLEAIRQRDDLVVVALCDRETDPLAAAARAYAVDLAVTSDQRLWCSKLDAVLIAGPERLHRKHIMGALEAGAHVFCVGPLAGFGSDASRLVAQAEGYPNQRVMVGQPLRFHPLFAAISQLLASGQLGEIYAVRVSQWAAAEAWPGDDPTRAEAAGGTPPLL
ncbi:MAG: Gfo/Idh/MocA family oxidoreductase, partial [Armatimonadetes bacterium]|nr:Gfo/Idh/MocA family oxidoreductase [Armatimonadota bacterium]